MKKILCLANLYLLIASAPAATLDLAEVDAMSINCLFSPSCAPQVSETFSPLTLPGSTGSGLLQTRVMAGETNSLGEGLYGYEYRIDLTALAATNQPPCSTNAVVCFTNRVQVTTNAASCRTNIVNGTNMVVCTTNRVAYFTNQMSCYTNLIPCPETTPCLESLRIPFGRAYTDLDFGTNDGAAAHAYVITSGSLGTIAPVFVLQDGDDILIQFAQPVCPGESSYFIGLVSTNPPGDVRADATLTSGDSVTVDARSPATGGGGIDCDLTELATAIADLCFQDLAAPNNKARAGRHEALLDLVRAADEAAEEGELDNVIEAVQVIVKKTSGGRGSWVTRAAAERLEPILDALVSCLEQAPSNGGDDDRDDDCDRNDDDKVDNDDGRKNNGHQGRGKAQGPPNKHGKAKQKNHRK